MIAIIAILISLLLPAVQAAREAARRAQCMNNQKQVALAITSYESAHGRLPPGGLVDANDDPNLAFGTFDPKSGKMISWAVLILPQMEEQNLYDMFDLKRSILDQPGAGSYSGPARIRSSRCMSPPTIVPAMVRTIAISSTRSSRREFALPKGTTPPL